MKMDPVRDYYDTWIQSGEKPRPDEACDEGKRPIECESVSKDGPSGDKLHTLSRAWCEIRLDEVRSQMVRLEDFTNGLSPSSELGFE